MDVTMKRLSVLYKRSNKFEKFVLPIAIEPITVLHPYQEEIRKRRYQKKIPTPKTEVGKN